LLKAKKRLKKKMPTRRSGEQYWNQEQFDKLCAAAPAKLASRGPLPWRLLAYMLAASPEVDRIRDLVGRRLMDPKKLEAGQKELDRMLLTLHRGGYVQLEPAPPGATGILPVENQEHGQDARGTPPAAPPATTGLFDLAAAGRSPRETDQQTEPSAPPPYRPELARPTAELPKLLLFRGVNPLYAVFLVSQLGIADRAERIQAMESVLELPGSVAHFVRVPRQNVLPPGSLATTRLDEQLLRLGLATADELAERPRDQEEFRPRRTFDEEPVYVLTLAQKLRRLFDYELPGVHDLRTSGVWAAGEVLDFGGDFNKYVTSKQLQKQEGMIFRHLLRLILLVAEFVQLAPPETTDEAWRGELADISNHLTDCCRAVDPTSTDNVLAQVAGEEPGDENDES
jgi:hypothetical protein